LRLFLPQNFSQITLAELCGVALIAIAQIAAGPPKKDLPRFIYDITPPKNRIMKYFNDFHAKKSAQGPRLSAKSRKCLSAAQRRQWGKIGKNRFFSTHERQEKD
jgi:hypothetical protein